jgi:hypothetical protein
MGQAHSPTTKAKSTETGARRFAEVPQKAANRKPGNFAVFRLTLEEWKLKPNTRLKAHSGHGNEGSKTLNPVAVYIYYLLPWLPPTCTEEEAGGGGALKKKQVAAREEEGARPPSPSSQPWSAQPTPLLHSFHRSWFPSFVDPIRRLFGTNVVAPQPVLFLSR